MPDKDSPVPEEVKDAVNQAFTEDDSADIAGSLQNIVQELRDPGDIRHLSHLSKEEIAHLSVIATFADDVTADFIQHFINLNVSKNRKGRNEFIELVQGLGAINKEQEETRMEQLKGLMG